MDSDENLLKMSRIYDKKGNLSRKIDHNCLPPLGKRKVGTLASGEKVTDDAFH